MLDKKDISHKSKPDLQDKKINNKGGKKKFVHKELTFLDLFANIKYSLYYFVYTIFY